MKTPILTSSLLALSLISFTVASAQQVQIDGVRPKEFRGVNPIKGKGYYTYYVNEKSGHGMVDFALELYDLDLNVIKKTNVEVTKNSNLSGSEFNGEDFLFVFNDLKKKTNTYITIDSEGNILKKKTEPVKKIASVGTVEIYPALDGSGFYITHSVKEKKWGFEVSKVDRDLKQLWSHTETVDKGMIGVATAKSGPGKVILITTQVPSLLSKKVSATLMAFNDATGAKEYEYSLYDGKQTNLPSSFLVEPDGTVATAGMYYDGEKMSGDNSDGIFFLKLDNSGNQLAYKSIDWDNGIQEALKATSRKFSIGSKPKVLFHEITKTKDGNYQVISETFRKALGAAGALAMMGGRNAADVPLRLTVMDFIIFNFDNNGEPLDINKIEKPYKSAEIYGGMTMNGIQLANYLKKYRMFTYDFTTVLPSGKQAIVYTNFEDAGLGKGKPYVGVSTIDQGKDTETEKIPLAKKYAAFMTGNPDNLKTGAMPGPSGKMCLFVYDRKAKAILMSIEELTVGS
jgi:hypothetical protein